MNFWSALLVVDVSAAPILELRAGVPIALAYGFSAASALALSLAGNLLVAPIVLPLLGRMEPWLLSWSWTRGIMQWLYARTRRKETWVRRLGPPALLLFVAIPFPGTGAWTGVLVAHLLGIPKRTAIAWISLGVVIAGIVVLLAALGVIHVFGLHPA